MKLIECLKLSSNATSGPAGDVQHVLDGGVLLYRIPWPRESATYQEIYVSRLYCSYVTKKNGNTVIWFDGYDGISTKNMTHHRRAAGKARATVTFMEDLIVTLKKDNFLANSKNKEWFINLLSRFLQENNCPTYHAVLDRRTAETSAGEKNTVVVGDGTYLLVLLCFYTGVQIAMTYISHQNQGQTPEDKSGT